MAGGSAEEMQFEGLDARERRAQDRRVKPGWWFRVWTGWRQEPDARRAESPAAWKPDPTRVGICCSGGGIRSAAYSLGALQRLQQAGVLQRAAYLSAVSGGSYIAAAMTLARRSAAAPFAPGSPEEQYLRNRTTYLVPHGSEAVFLGYRVLLGIAINLVFLGLTIGLPALLLGLAFRWWGWAEGARSVHAPDWPLQVAGGLAAASLLLALYYIFRRFAKPLRGNVPAPVPPGPNDPVDGPPTGPTRHRLVVQTWTVRLLGLAVTVAFALVVLPDLAGWILDPGDPGQRNDATIAIPAAVVTFVAGLLSQLLARPPKELGANAGRVAKAGRAIWPRLLRALAGVAATVAVPLLAVAWAGAVTAWAVLHVDATITLLGAELRSVWVAFGLGAVTVAALYARGDLTSWSLHPFYRARLASVFAQRRGGADGREAVALDTYRQIPRLQDAQPPATSPGAPAGEKPPWPELVICAAANISDPGATPHGRRVSSFTFSSEAIGGPLVGYVPTGEYEGGIENLRSDVMTAVAVSGAALSPSMGKMTYRAGRALLALANVRLGVWLPNPRNTPSAVEGAPAPRRPPSRPRPYRLLAEMLGKNGLRDRYLYVSDGGHYENLGLVELLRRGCTRIYCFDGGGGRGIGAALGDAIALARSELQVDIVVPARKMARLEPNKRGISAADHVVADVYYLDANGLRGEKPDGKLIYARQLLTANAPQDVHAHARRNPKFPHDPTSDQFLTDQAFESYRAIGRLAAENALEESLDP
jgi:patatin-like phospholipase